MDIFKEPDEVADNAAMSHSLPITMEQLAKTASRFFLSADLRDVPAKLWVDCYWATSQVYLRATFERSYTNAGLIRLAGLKHVLEREHSVELVVVVYAKDMSWDEAELTSDRLNAVT